MNNSKRNIHSSGPLGMLLNRGLVAKVDVSQNETNNDVVIQERKEQKDTNTEYFLDKNTGIQFKENELITVDPNECEPWEYANRMPEEMGDIDELIESIRVNGQLQPALIREHPAPHENIKYQVIFGRRRHFACSKLNLPLLAIKKDFLSIQDAIATQDTENRSRKNISNFSNAFLYKRLIQDGVFNGEKEIADKLGIPKSSFSELMVFTKIPQEILQKIPNIHGLSVNLALEIVSILKKNKDHLNNLLKIAPQIGISITSPEKLRKAMKENREGKLQTLENLFEINSSNGQRLFTYKVSNSGKLSVLLHGDISEKIDKEAFCNHIKTYLETLA